MAWQIVVFTKYMVSRSFWVILGTLGHFRCHFYKNCHYVQMASILPYFRFKVFGCFKGGASFFQSHHQFWVTAQFHGRSFHGYFKSPRTVMVLESDITLLRSKHCSLHRHFIISTAQQKSTLQALAPQPMHSAQPSSPENRSKSSSVQYVNIIYIGDSLVPNFLVHYRDGPMELK